MRHVLILAAAIILCGCEKDDNRSEQTFFVNVFTQSAKDAEVKLAVSSNDNIKCFVYLFEDKGKTINEDESYFSVNRDKQIIYTDGTKEKYKYIPNSPGTAVNTFANIPNGNYIIWVMIISYGYVHGVSCKNITVNNDYHMTIEEKIFLYRSTSFFNYGWQEWEETW